MDTPDYKGLAEVLLETEQKLRDLNLGVSAEVDFQRPGTDYIYRLGFGKRDGEWKLYVVFPDPRDKDETWDLLANCSVEFRLAAAEHLYSLRDALYKEHENRIVDVDSAIGVYENFLETLED